jgi:hypothetical protein
MLQSQCSSSSAIPLFSPSSPSSNIISSSCNMHVSPSPINDMISFDWSDFPVVSEQLHGHHHFNLCPSYESKQQERREEEATKTTLFPKMSPQSESESQSYSCSAALKDDQSRRKVSFASTLQVRTHSIVLGDHPCCRELPLQLGWDYDETELINLDIREEFKSPYTPKASRLSFLERKNLLKRVSGMTERDLKDAMS